MDRPAPKIGPSGYPLEPPSLYGALDSLTSWPTLRAVGNLRVLKVSYVALAMIPFVKPIIQSLAAYGLDPSMAARTYFAALSLAVANLIYDISCPSIIKRFESPNDLYERMLGIKLLSAAMYPKDMFEADIEHCVRAYKRAARATPAARFAVALLLATAGILLGLLILERTVSVANLV